jgi:DNA-binding transcriptional LysR family regulator
MKATLDIPTLTAFVTVVRAGTFTAAARTLRTHKTHLSRVVSRLESQLGVQLIRRTTRSLTATEVGRELFQRATCVLTALEETERAISQAQGEPRGVLRLTCGVEFGVLAVSHWVSRYLSRYPKTRAEADFTNRMVDIVHEGIDVAIRVGVLGDSGLSARKLGDIRYALYASPKYMRGRPSPKLPGDLAEHDLVAHSPTGAATMGKLTREKQAAEINKTPRLVVNNSMAAREATVAGLGIAVLPSYMAAPLVADKRLVQVLPGWERPSVPVHAVFASSRFLAPTVRAFVDLARQEFDETLLQS